MNDQKYNEGISGVLTERMDIGTAEFEAFQALLLNKARARSEEQMRHIELLALKFQMEDYLSSNEPDIKPIGDFIKSFLRVVSVRQNKFAKYLGLQPSNLSKLLKGDRPISHEMALILGNIFPVEPMMWLNIQAKNELKKLLQSNQGKYSKYSLGSLLAE